MAKKNVNSDKKKQATNWQREVKQKIGSKTPNKKCSKSVTNIWRQKHITINSKKSVRPGWLQIKKKKQQKKRK